METKPYNLQSPEQIAKDYGGNKQKIAEAMQMGIIDPTAGTLAGMFIDRMRSAAQAEQAPQQTVAQKTFAPPAPPAPPQGGLPPAPMGAPPMGGAPAGLGATPEAAQMAPMPDMPAPEMAAPEMPQQEAPMGMAEGGMVPPYASGGGLSDVPIPSGMFDEPDNGSYANGGIVAFGPGGDVTDPLAWMRSTVTSPYGMRAAGKHEGMDFGVGANTPIGAPAPGVAKVGYDDINGNFVRIFHPDGTSSSYSHLAKATVKDGQEVGPADVIGLSGNTGRVRGANGGYHLHFGARDAQGNRIDPGSFFRSIEPQTASGKWNKPAPAEGSTSDVPGGNLVDEMPAAYERAGQFYDKFMPKPKTEARDKMKARVQEQMSEESQKKEKDYDKWSTLAEIGFNIAGSNSPNFLQAVGAAASAALPGARQAKKDREARADKLLTQYAEIEGIENAEARERVKFMIDFGKTELDLKDKDLTRAVSWAGKKMEDVTQRRGQDLSYDASIFSSKSQKEASMASASAQESAIYKTAVQKAWSDAQAELSQNGKYRESKDQAAKDKMLQDRANQLLAIYLNMAQSGAGGAGGAPQMPPGFVPDK
jgi:hypothetical protein